MRPRDRTPGRPAVARRASGRRSLHVPGPCGAGRMPLVSAAWKPLLRPIRHTWRFPVIAQHFAELLRGSTAPRRAVLGGGLVTVAGRLGLRDGEARKRRSRKKRPKKPKPNVYGCLSVGASCKRADQCCSGICEGKKGKWKCRAHDTGTCDQRADGYCEAGNPYLAQCNGGGCLCFRTTGGSRICAGSVQCEACQRDTDCLALGYPPGSACAPVSGDLACADICEAGMACVTPCGPEK